jgi:hypothetical protein
VLLVVPVVIVAVGAARSGELELERFGGIMRRSGRRGTLKRHGAGKLWGLGKAPYWRDHLKLLREGMPMDASNACSCTARTGLWMLVLGERLDNSIKMLP